MPTAHVTNRSTGAFLLLIGAMLLPAQPALASPMLLVQMWERDDFATSGQTARTAVVFDPSGIIGLGAERAYATSANFLTILNGVNQNFFEANIIDPLVFGQESDPYADYLDGVLLGIRQLDLGGNNVLGLFPGGHGLTMAATELTYFIPPTTTRDYILVSSELSTLPEPGPLALLATAWIASLVVRRRAR